MEQEIVIAGPVRTAIGAFNGAFAEVPATVLGSAAMKHRRAKIGIDTLCIGGGEAVAMAVELLGD